MSPRFACLCDALTQPRCPLPPARVSPSRLLSPLVCCFARTQVSSILLLPFNFVRPHLFTSNMADHYSNLQARQAAVTNKLNMYVRVWFRSSSLILRACRWFAFPDWGLQRCSPSPAPSSSYRTSFRLNSHSSIVSYFIVSYFVDLWSRWCSKLPNVSLLTLFRWCRRCRLPAAVAVVFFGMAFSSPRFFLKHYTHLCLPHPCLFFVFVPFCWGCPCFHERVRRLLV